MMSEPVGSGGVVKAKRAPRKRKAAPAVSKPVEVEVEAVESPAAREFPYYVAARPMKRNGQAIKVGDVIEDAASWPRLESWIRARYVSEVTS